MKERGRLQPLLCIFYSHVRFLRMSADARAQSLRDRSAGPSARPLLTDFQEIDVVSLAQSRLANAHKTRLFSTLTTTCSSPCAVCNKRSLKYSNNTYQRWSLQFRSSTSTTTSMATNWPSTSSARSPPHRACHVPWNGARRCQRSNYLGGDKI